jgi:hypothetical protein
MPNTVVLVHGYSVRSLSAYGQFPALLVSEGFTPASIELSAFDSLDNNITCDDLALALEEQVTLLESRGQLDVATSAFVVHSTGAIVTRRWMLNRLKAIKPLPSHFISLAGANHGSTLAQLGASRLNQIHDQLQKADGYGQQVLNDLDYGSAFLRLLNREWLTAINKGALETFLFSMIGDDHSDLADQIFWQTKEPACDSTVRVCGGNLNYTWITANPDGNPPMLTPEVMKVEVPHLVVHGFSHTGDRGIIDSVRSTRDAPFAALMDALRVTDQQSYRNLATRWAATTSAWSVQLPDQNSSLLVFRLTDESGRPITDSVIFLTDKDAATGTIAPMLQPHQPIQNAVDGSAVSFYVQHAAFSGGHVAAVQISPRSGSPLIDYRDVTYDASAHIMSIVQPNETTYIDVSVNRDVSQTYRLVNYSTKPDVNAQWPPLPA